MPGFGREPEVCCAKRFPQFRSPKLWVPETQVRGLHNPELRSGSALRWWINGAEIGGSAWSHSGPQNQKSGPGLVRIATTFSGDTGPVITLTELPTAHFPTAPSRQLRRVAGVTYG